MPSSVYVALSAQVALERRLTTIANNVANMNTPGFRAEGSASTASSRGQAPTMSPSPRAANATSRAQAGRSSRPAIRSTSPSTATRWFAISTPAGVVNTRDGRLQMTANGELQTRRRLSRARCGRRGDHSQSRPPAM